MEKSRIQEKGFSIVTAMLVLGAVVAGGLYILQAGSSNFKDAARLDNKFSVETLNSLIVANVTYEETCKKAISENLTPEEVTALIANGSSEISLKLPSGSIVKKGENPREFEVAVQSFTITEFRQVKTHLDYNFFVGSLVIKSVLTKEDIVGGRDLPNVNLGSFAALVDQITGKMIACATSLDALEDNSVFVEPKTKLLNAQIDLKSIKDDFMTFKDIASQKPGEDFRYDPQQRCDYYCQVMRDYFSQNPVLDKADASIDPRFLAQNFLSKLKAAGNDPEKIINSFIAVGRFFQTAGSEDAGFALLDKFISASEQPGFGAELKMLTDKYLEAIQVARTNEAKVTAPPVENPSPEVREKVRKIIETIGSNGLKNWLDSGHTIDEAIEAGLH